MADRVTIFNRWGVALAELQVDTVRAWRLRDAGTCSFQISKIAEPGKTQKCTAANLALRNLILVESDKVQNWVGYIAKEPHTEDEASVTVTAISAERLFDFHLTGANDILTGASGAIALTLASNAQNEETLGVTVASANFEAASDSITREYHKENVGKALNDLAADTNSYWWIEGVAVGGNLALTMRWRANRGETFLQWLEEGGNMNVIGYSEEGKVYSRVTAWGKFEEWSAPLMVSVNDADALAAYGLIEMPLPMLTVTDESSLTVIAQATLDQMKTQRRVITGEITKAPYPQTGDTVTVRLVKHSLVAGGFGGMFTMRVQAASFDSRRNVQRVVLREM